MTIIKGVIGRFIHIVVSGYKKDNLTVILATIHSIVAANNPHLQPLSHSCDLMCLISSSV